ncbi:hypothetical protein [Variovorax sp. GT1P44]|uniref:hypothetical protein n=1 Tax=Variovorax sp. GT1P44 TaxID=3443742 RepID=UPI003F44A023
MTHARLPLAAAIAAALLATATIATAQDAATQPAVHTLGEHPAILVKRQAPKIDPNTFILMHPAGLFVIAAPTEADDQSPVAAAKPTSTNADAMPVEAHPRGELSAAVAVSPIGH